MAESIHKELVAPNDTKYLVKIREIVQEAASHIKFAEREVGRIVLAVDEAVANVMEHAYEDMKGQGEIRITIDADPECIKIMITDCGREFDPLAVTDPNISEHVSKGKKKGLGVFLMRQIMDEVKYTFVEGLRNELKMIKYVKKQGGKN